MKSPVNCSVIVLFVVVLGIAASAGQARADEFLGIDPDASADMDTETETSSGAESGAESGGGGTFSFSGGFSASQDTLGGQATVGYWFNKWFGIETTYSYHQLDAANDAGVTYGPDVAGVLRAPNPTIVTPFVGAGVGYVKWQRSHDDEVFDAGSAMTASAFGGANVALTRHFGLQVARRQTRFLQRPPVSYDDRETREPTTRLATSVGFYMAF